MRQSRTYSNFVVVQSEGRKICSSRVFDLRGVLSVWRSQLEGLEAAGAQKIEMSGTIGFEFFPPSDRNIVPALRTVSNGRKDKILCESGCNRQLTSSLPMTRCVSLGLGSPGSQSNQSYVNATGRRKILFFHSASK
jgi:hypothetical protein